MMHRSVYVRASPTIRGRDVDWSAVRLIMCYARVVLSTVLRYALLVGTRTWLIFYEALFSNIENTRFRRFPAQCCNSSELSLSFINRFKKVQSCKRSNLFFRMLFRLRVILRFLIAKKLVLHKLKISRSMGIRVHSLVHAIFSDPLVVLFRVL